MIEDEACPRRRVRGAAWARAQKMELGGRAWAEVYCGTPEAGAWVHLDPILGTVDRCGPCPEAWSAVASFGQKQALPGRHWGTVVQVYRLERLQQQSQLLFLFDGVCAVVLSWHRAHHVERGTVRERPLAYVVAFSGCTAKDVTQRCKPFPAVCCEACCTPSPALWSSFASSARSF